MSAPGAVYTPVKRCIDCGAALDTSLAKNARVCARDGNRRRALTFLRAALPYARAAHMEDFGEAIRSAIRSGEQGR